MASTPCPFSASSSFSSCFYCHSNSNSSSYSSTPNPFRLRRRLSYHHGVRRRQSPLALAFRVSLPPNLLPTTINAGATSGSFATPKELWCSNFTTEFTYLQFRFNCVARRATESDVQIESSSPSSSPSSIDCVGTGLDVECLVGSETDGFSQNSNSAMVTEEAKLEEVLSSPSSSTLMGALWEWTLLVSPFFFWGTAMVAMKEVLPKTGPFFVSSFRLIPAGLLLVAFAASRGRPLPSGFTAWFSISLFALVDATCFQGFLAEGLERTSAGLGSVIIDSQPLTVAVLATLLFGESIGLVGASGLVLGVIGLLLLEVPALSFDASNFSLWGSGEWWMLLAAQSMAVGTVMVRWVSKYSDPVMATGWHMVIGGLPLLVISILNHDPVFSGRSLELTSTDLSALLYTSIFGSAISYGVFFYNATRGSLTKLSSLTFLTPMFASVFGFLYLGETFSPVQLVGASIILAAIYMVNYKANLK